MAGEKIELVRQTLKYITELLGDQDRLSLIQFDHTAQRLTPLKCVGKNREYFGQAIESLHD